MERHSQGLPLPLVDTPTAKVLDAPVITVQDKDADGILVLHLCFFPWVMGRFILVVIGLQLEGQIIEILVLAEMHLHDGKKSKKNNKYHIIRRWDAPLDKCMFCGFSYCSRKVVTS